MSYRALQNPLRAYTNRPSTVVLEGFGASRAEGGRGSDQHQRRRQVQPPRPPERALHACVGWEVGARPLSPSSTSTATRNRCGAADFDVTPPTVPTESTAAIRSTLSASAAEAAGDRACGFGGLFREQTHTASLARPWLLLHRECETTR